MKTKGKAAHNHMKIESRNLDRHGIAPTIENVFTLTNLYIRGYIRKSPAPGDHKSICKKAGTISFRCNINGNLNI